MNLKTSYGWQKMQQLLQPISQVLTPDPDFTMPTLLSALSPKGNLIFPGSFFKWTKSTRDQQNQNVAADSSTDHVVQEYDCKQEMSARCQEDRSKLPAQDLQSKVDGKLSPTTTSPLSQEIDQVCKTIDLSLESLREEFHQNLKVFMMNTETMFTDYITDSVIEESDRTGVTSQGNKNQVLDDITQLKSEMIAGYRKFNKEASTMRGQNNKFVNKLKPVREDFSSSTSVSTRPVNSEDLQEPLLPVNKCSTPDFSLQEDFVKGKVKKLDAKLVSRVESYGHQINLTASHKFDDTSCVDQRLMTIAYDLLFLKSLKEHQQSDYCWRFDWISDTAD